MHEEDDDRDIVVSDQEEVHQHTCRDYTHSIMASQPVVLYVPHHMTMLTG